MKALMIVFLVCASIVSGTEVNWFSKSLDNFGLTNCSWLGRSNVIGGFQTCMNRPPDPQKTKRSVFMGNWNAVLLGGWIPSSGDKHNSKPEADPSLVWPGSMCNSTQGMLNCFPLLTESECLTESERAFFNTTSVFFQAQHDYVCEEAPSVYPVLQNSSCAHKAYIDVAQQCFSTTVVRYNWLGWPLNYEDNQMCNFMIDLRDCETGRYKKCPEEVRDFVETGIWNTGLRAVNCSMEKVVPTTEASRWPWPMG